MSHNFATELPPPGLESNFDDPPSLYRSILATVIVSYVATTLLTAARIVTKKSMSAWMLEDCTSDALNHLRLRYLMYRF